MLRNTLLPPIQTPARDPVSNGRYSGLFADLVTGTYRFEGRRSVYRDVFENTRPGSTTILDANGDLITVLAGQPALGPDGQQIWPLPVTNYSAWSRLLSNWGGQGYEVTDDSTLGPDGAFSMSRVNLTPRGDRRGLVDFGYLSSYTSGQVRYLSCYFRRVEESVSTFAIGMWNGSARFCWGAYDVEIEEFSTVSYAGAGTLDLVKVENIKDDLWRLEVKWTCALDAGFRVCINAGVGNAQALYNGENLLQTGAIGAGFLSVSDIRNAPYIPTNGAAQTRAADNVSVPGIDKYSWFVTDRFTALLDAQYRFTNDQVMFSLVTTNTNSATSVQCLRLRKNSDNSIALTLAMSNGSTISAATPSSFYEPFIDYKIGVSVGPGKIVLSINGHSWESQGEVEALPYIRAGFGERDRPCPQSLRRFLLDSVVTAPAELNAITGAGL